MDYSKQGMEKQLMKKYGKTSVELRKNLNFNIWEAYSFLKKYAGFDEWLGETEYRKRINIITELLGV